MGQLPHYSVLRERAERIRWSIWRRAQAACVAAGLDCYGTVHNALVSYDQGRPWPRVDYSKARLAKRLFDEQFKGTRWLSELVRTRGLYAFDWT